MTTAREKISPEAIQRLREFIEHAPSDEDREIFERILRNRRAVLERKIRAAERKQQNVREDIDELHRNLAEMRHTLEEIKRELE
jgi:predicted RNase H-like nuclease (RuvC/YqgF family)